MIKVSAAAAATAAGAFKRSLCRNFMQSGHCGRGDRCTFAHGEHELTALPVTSGFAKTRLCTHWTRGTCTRGGACNFAHGEHEIQMPAHRQARPSCVAPRCAAFLGLARASRAAPPVLMMTNGVSSLFIFWTRSPRYSSSFLFWTRLVQRTASVVLTVRHDGMPAPGHPPDQDAPLP